MATTSTPLPGLGGAPDYRRFAPQEAQAIASSITAAMFGLLNRMHSDLSAKDGAEFGDGAPIVAGAIGGILLFMLQSDMPDDKIRAMFTDNVDLLLPQMRMDLAAGGSRGGRA